MIILFSKLLFAFVESVSFDGEHLGDNSRGNYIFNSFWSENQIVIYILLGLHS